MFAYLLSQIHVTEKAGALWAAAGVSVLATTLATWTVAKTRKKIYFVVGGVVITGFFVGASFVAW